MQYKTIVHEIIQQRPELKEKLRASRRTLQALDLYAGQLKASHEAWKEQLSQTNPASDRSQIASQALEIALQELMTTLPPESIPEEDELLSLDDAMNFIRPHTMPE